MDIFSEDRFTNEDAARAYLEGSLWPEGPVCAHCGSLKAPYANAAKRGVYRCSEKECRKDFTVTTGTVMERSHIALHKWVQAFHLMCSSKKGISAHQLHRLLKITYKAAWFMAHRIRESMRDGGLGTLGGGGKIVEADETYYGKTEQPQPPSKSRKGYPFTKGGTAGPRNKRAIVALVERGGNVRTFHVAAADKPSVQKIVRDNVARETRLHTDESRLYLGIDAHFDAHKTVHHTSKEYARTDYIYDADGEPFERESVHTNSAEGYFSIFKRGMRGIYQHCGEKHLHRYLAEYDFRYNHRVKLGFNDTDRADIAVKQASGKRLTYRQSH